MGKREKGGHNFCLGHGNAKQRYVVHTYGRLMPNPIDGDGTFDDDNHKPSPIPPGGGLTGSDLDLLGRDLDDVRVGAHLQNHIMMGGGGVMPVSHWQRQPYRGGWIRPPSILQHMHITLWPHSTHAQEKTPENATLCTYFHIFLLFSWMAQAQKLLRRYVLKFSKKHGRDSSPA